MGIFQLGLLVVFMFGIPPIGVLFMTTGGAILVVIGAVTGTVFSAITTDEVINSVLVSKIYFI
jgi:hypothetical protein